MIPKWWKIEFMKSVTENNMPLAIWNFESIESLIIFQNCVFSFLNQ